MRGVCFGMTIVALMPRRFAASATPCAWLPADAAITPRAFSSSVNFAILLYAPRTLKEPVICKFSGLIYTSLPLSSENTSL